MSVAADIYVDSLIPLPASLSFSYIDAGSCLDPNTELATGNVLRWIVYTEEVPYPCVDETHVDWTIENTLNEAAIIEKKKHGVQPGLEST